MKPIARMITRPHTEGSDVPDIALVAFMKSQSVLKANRVYEIREILGDLMIVDIGENVLVGETVADRRGMPCWGQGVSTVMDDGGKHLYLTKDEYASLYPPKED